MCDLKESSTIDNAVQQEYCSKSLKSPLHKNTKETGLLAVEFESAQFTAHKNCGNASHYYAVRVYSISSILLCGPCFRLSFYSEVRAFTQRRPRLFAL